MEIDLQKHNRIKLIINNKNRVSFNDIKKKKSENIIK